MQKTATIIFISVLLSGFLWGDVVVDFDDTSDLTAYFNGDSSVADSNVSSGGLNNSGRVQVGGEDCWTLKTGTGLTAGATYSVSAYMYNNANSGYGYLGFAIASGNDLAGIFGAAPVNALGVDFHGGGGSFHNNTSTQSSDSWSWGEDHPLGYWFRYTYTVTFNNDDTFDGTFAIDQADADGTIVSHFGTQTFDGYVNSSVSGADVIYAYFGTSGTGRYTSVDEFSTNAVPEPASVALLCVVSGIGLLIRRRLHG